MEYTIGVSLICLLIASAFFSASETALLSLDKIKLKNKVQKGDRKAHQIEKLLEHPDRLLSTILIGNNVVNILASALATTLFGSLFGALGVAISTVTMTILVLIFGEITPKSLATKFSFNLSRIVVGPLHILMKILSPLVFLLSSITKLILKLFGIEHSQDVHAITEEEVRMMVNLSEETGMLKDYEKNMIQNVFEFDDIEVREIMIPRVYMTTIAVSASYHEVLECIQTHQFSRIPVYEEHLDNIIGVLYVKDLLFLQSSDINNFNLRQYLKKAFFVSEFMKLNDLFKEMQKRKTHLAIVIDEYGGTSGMTTMEDLIEEVLGDIEDEYDFEEEEVVKIKDHLYLIDAKMKISALNEILKLDLPEENVSSIGGFIFEQIGKVPSLKQRIFYKDLIFIVEEMEQRSIKKLKLITKRDQY